MFLLKAASVVPPVSMLRPSPFVNGKWLWAEWVADGGKQPVLQSLPRNASPVANDLAELASPFKIEGQLALLHGGFESSPTWIAILRSRLRQSGGRTCEGGDKMISLWLLLARCCTCFPPRLPMTLASKSASSGFAHDRIVLMRGLAFGLLPATLAATANMPSSRKKP